MKILKIMLALFAGAFLLNACQKEYSVENGGIKTATGNWEFKDSGHQYIGTIDTAYIAAATNGKELHIMGKSTDGSQSFNLTLYADTFKVGAYKASLFQSALDYSGAGKMIYQASQIYGEFTVNILSITPDLITGSFSGLAKDTSGVLKQLFEGKFVATFATVPSEPVSVGILGDSSGSCKPVVLNGLYQQGITATSANTVQVQVTVAAAGTYNIFTDPVNGITFSTTGTFSGTGPQTLLLNATGVPVLAGDQNFTLHYGNSQCAFKVTFLPGAAPSNDYYPLTTNSNWTYGENADSFMYKILPNTKTLNNNTYSILGVYDVPPGQATDSVYLRKSTGNYFSYVDYSTYLHFDDPVFAETIILKDNVAKGNSWNSATVSGKISGVAVSGYLTFTILDKAVPATVGGFNFNDIIKVKMDIYLGPALIGSYEMWYAKNVGLVYMTNGSNTYQVGDYHIF